MKKIILAAALLSGMVVNAAKDQGKMNVLVKVNQGCYLTDIQDAVFDAFDGTFFVDRKTDSGSISVICTTDVPYSIGLNEGEHAADAKRYMYNEKGDKKIHYELYSDSKYTTEWLDIGSDKTVDALGIGAEQSYVVYAQIPQGQTSVPVGLYQDVVTVTLEF